MHVHTSEVSHLRVYGGWGYTYGQPNDAVCGSQDESVSGSGDSVPFAFAALAASGADVECSCFVAHAREAGLCSTECFLRLILLGLCLRCESGYAVAQ